jgi:hypothetical protein
MLVRRHIYPFGTIAIALFVAMAAQSANAQGTSEGPNNPGTVVSTAGPFAKPWTNPDRGSTSDNIDATSTVSAPLQQTDFLDATNFGFTIPGDRIVRRIEVRVEGRASSLITTAQVQLLKGGVPVGNPMSVFFPGSASDGVITLNDQDEVVFDVPLTLWGATWTPAEINAADFGVRMDFEAVAGSPVTFEVDSVRVWVYSFPTLPAAGGLGLFAVAGALLFTGSIVLLRNRRRTLTA